MFKNAELSYRVGELQEEENSIFFGAGPNGNGEIIFLHSPKHVGNTRSRRGPDSKKLMCLTDIGARASSVKLVIGHCLELLEWRAPKDETNQQATNADEWKVIQEPRTGTVSYNRVPLFLPAPWLY